MDVKLLSICLGNAWKFWRYCCKSVALLSRNAIFSRRLVLKLVAETFSFLNMKNETGKRNTLKIRSLPWLTFPEELKY